MDQNKVRLNNQLYRIVRSLEQDGILDQNFRSVHMAKETISPFFVAELIPYFFRNTQSTLAQMTEILSRPVVDYHDLDERAVRLKGSSSSIGAPRVAQSCAFLRRAIGNRSRPACAFALIRLKHEYHVLHDKLDVILQLERRIVSHEGALDRPRRIQ